MRIKKTKDVLIPPDIQHKLVGLADFNEQGVEEYGRSVLPNAYRNYDKLSEVDIDFAMDNISNAIDASITKEERASMEYIFNKISEDTNYFKRLNEIIYKINESDDDSFYSHETISYEFDNQARQLT